MTVCPSIWQLQAWCERLSADGTHADVLHACVPIINHILETSRAIERLQQREELGLLA